MNAYEYAIIAAANTMQPDELGYQTAQQWKSDVIDQVALDSPSLWADDWKET